MMLKFVVIDDEPLALEVLDGYLKKLDGVHSASLFSHTAEALLYLENHQVDVLLLDIKMPEMTGIEFLKALSDPPLTIFTTAYRNYAFEGYELGVIDFLLKPISFTRFNQSISKVREFLELKMQHSKIEAISDESENFVFVKSGVQRIKLQFDDVIYIQGLKDYAIVFTHSGKILLKGSIKAMLDIFPNNRFVRVHKSFIVSIQKITRLESNQVLLNSQQIPIGRHFKDDLEKSLTAR
ncbi:LytTR family DNA-binding domain-containing protein [Mucilaginibacter sabulilitoris]|uniref:LytTR family DNA-binding domain-containing protein n=1 Tax=Mucilaginibacter sabulilitoris TaxID=1173583 RepID=A0ABZ0TD74_9SPHI|nr:LytTR family DNA-binding domain-containing protein [Mucilaginibacter sabulilitoris]WPU90912.1 LytTR family DNA-binding domain-containing protein [Mucilaginibacter sabulilitoris]